jgi:O-antigen ligase
MLAKDNIERKVSKRPQNIVCANHAHNYYLEFLSEAGIIGSSLLVIFFLILLKDTFYFLRRHYQQINSEMILLVPIVVLFFLEIWPIKSTGSFFTTWGATFFWLNVGLLIAGTSKKT